MKKDKGRLYFIPAWIGTLLLILNVWLSALFSDTLFHEIFLYVAAFGSIICAICAVVMLVVHVKFKKKGKEIEGDADKGGNV
jgi:uncharacterized membrane protein